MVASTQWHSLMALDFGRADERADVGRTPAAEEPRLDIADPVAWHRRTGTWVHAVLELKAPWLLRQLTDTPALLVGLPEYVYASLLGDSGASASSASGTGLFDWAKNAWDDEAIDAARIPRDRCQSSCQTTGPASWNRPGRSGGRSSPGAVASAARRWRRLQPRRGLHRSVSGGSHHRYVSRSPRRPAGERGSGRSARALALSLTGTASSAESRSLPAVACSPGPRTSSTSLSTPRARRSGCATSPSAATASPCPYLAGTRAPRHVPAGSGSSPDCRSAPIRSSLSPPRSKACAWRSRAAWRRWSGHSTTARRARRRSGRRWWRLGEISVLAAPAGGCHG